jgi:hypothetical protein
MPPERGVEPQHGKARAAFPDETRCLLIFGGSDYYASRRHQKSERREILQTWQASLTFFLDWSDHAITSIRTNHQEHIPRPGRYPLIVSPIVGSVRPTNVPMDGGSGVNIIYSTTLDAMGLDRERS